MNSREKTSSGPAAPRPTEVIAREEISRRFGDILRLTRSQDPLAWDLMRQKLAECDQIVATGKQEMQRRFDRRCGLTDEALAGLGQTKKAEQREDDAFIAELMRRLSSNSNLTAEGQAARAEHGPSIRAGIPPLRFPDGSVCFFSVSDIFHLR